MMTMKIPGTGMGIRVQVDHVPQTVEATQVGRDRAETFAVEGEELQVLLALVHHGRQTPTEVAQNAHVDEAKTKAMLNSFIKRGWATMGATR